MAGILGVPIIAMALPPAEDAQGANTAAVAVAIPVRQLSHASPSRLPDQAAMVLAGTALIGAAAAVRRAA